MIFPRTLLAASVVSGLLCCPRIVSPKDGAHPKSAYLAITGLAERGARVEILDGARKAGVAEAAEDGRFHKVIHLDPGLHEIGVRYERDASSVRATVGVSMEGAWTPPSAPAEYENLQEADVILMHTLHTDQDDLYSPTYTHASLYLGGDADGTPRIAEAVPDDLAQGFGQVRTVPIERSIAYRESSAVGFFRAVPPLTPAERDGVIAFARSVVDRDLRFWSAADDFGAFYRAWLLWDPKLDRPSDEARFSEALQALEKRKFSNDRFNCTTLVWRAYFAGSRGSIDLSNPNRAEIGGTLSRIASPALLERLRASFVAPDTLYRSGKLQRVD